MCEVYSRLLELLENFGKRRSEIVVAMSVLVISALINMESASYDKPDCNFPILCSCLMHCCFNGISKRSLDLHRGAKTIGKNPTLLIHLSYPFQGCRWEPCTSREVPHEGHRWWKFCCHPTCAIHSCHLNILLRSNNISICKDMS